MERIDEVMAGPSETVLGQWRRETDGNNHTWVRKLIANWCREHSTGNSDVFALLEAGFRRLEQDHMTAGYLTPGLAGRRALLSHLLYVAIEIEFGKGILEDIKACL